MCTLCANSSELKTLADCIRHKVKDLLNQGTGSEQQEGSEQEVSAENSMKYTDGPPDEQVSRLVKITFCRYAV